VAGEGDKGTAKGVFRARGKVSMEYRRLERRSKNKKMCGQKIICPRKKREEKTVDMVRAIGCLKWEPEKKGNPKRNGTVPPPTITGRRKKGVGKSTRGDTKSRGKRGGFDEKPKGSGTARRHGKLKAAEKEKKLQNCRKGKSDEAAERNFPDRGAGDRGRRSLWGAKGAKTTK